MAKQWFALTVALGMSLGAVGLAHAGDDKNAKDPGEITYPDPQSGDDADDADVMPPDSTLPAEEMSLDSPLDLENQSGMEGNAHSLKGEEAKQLQMKLQEKGFYQGKIDGQIGPKTLQALKDFQKEQGLEPSGSFDAQTKTALGITSGSDVQPVKGSEGGSDTGETGTTPMEPTEPTESTEPMDSTEPTEPTEPSDTSSGIDAQSGTESTGSSTHPTTGASTDAGTSGSTDSATGAASGSPHGSGDVDMQAGGGSSMKMGDHTAHLKSAQEKLKAQGYFTGKADGTDNEEFKTALRKFQRAKGIPESGSLDEKTASALGITMGVGTEVKPQSGTDDDTIDDTGEDGDEGEAPVPETP